MHKKILIILTTLFILSSVPVFAETEARKLAQDDDLFFLHWDPFGEEYTIQYLGSEWTDIAVTKDTAWAGHLPYDRIRIISADEKSETILLAAEQAATPSLLPLEVEAEAQPLDRSVILTWESNYQPEGAADYYEILRKIPGGEFESVGLVPDDVFSWTDKDLENNTNYIYRIQPTNYLGSVYTELEATPTANDKSVDAVINAINEIPDEITLETDLESIRDAYESLSDSNKLRVVNIDKLQSAEDQKAKLQKEADKEKTEEASAVIQDMDKDSLAEAVKAYEDLNDEQRELMSDEEERQLSDAIREHNLTSKDKILDPTDPIRITEKMIEVKDTVYTGDYAEPEAVITDGDRVLVEGMDYVIYSLDTEAGKATAEITGLDGYYGEVEVEFNILPKPVTPDIELDQDNFTYNGKAVHPKVSVKNEEIESYGYSMPKKCIDIGIYKITVIPRGNYTGTSSREFYINPAPVKAFFVYSLKDSLGVNWARPELPENSGFEIQYGDTEDFSDCETITVSSTKRKTILKGTDPDSHCYVRIRTFVDINGRTLYSDWKTKEY